MTLPASGTITFNNFNTEAGRASGTNIDFGWIYSNTKTGQQSYTISNYYSKAWYQRNQDGNCNNGNCTNCANCNCGNLNCGQCIRNTINCTNCDTRSWFQNNCNCACTYNCSQTQCFTYNCDCACCFPANAMVRMANGDYKRISSIRVGDKIDGGYGYINNVIAYHEIRLGNQPFYIINGRHITTREHRHWTDKGWAAIDISAAAPEYEHEITVDNNGTKERRKNIKFKNTIVSSLTVGMSFITNNGPEIIHSIEERWGEDPDQLVYTLVCDGSHTHIVNGVIVSAWARDDDFNYNTWQYKDIIS